jgi:hypothetical protein
MNHVQTQSVNDPLPAPAWEYRAVGVRHQASTEGKRSKAYESGSELLNARKPRPSSGTPKAAAHSAFLMCRSCALPPAPRAPCSAGMRVLAQLRPVSVRPYVPLMCKPAASQRSGRRVPPPRLAATINRTMHSRPDHFVVHSREIHPPRDVLKYAKTDENRPFLHTPAPSSF